MDKFQLRKHLSQTRLNVTSPLDKSKNISDKFINLFAKQKCDGVFCYVSIGTEVDTISLLHALSKTTNVYLPYTTNQINAIQYQPSFTLKADKLGNMSDIVPIFKDISTLNVVAIVPLLGFNDDLYRIGYGGGYYDKYLKDFSGLKVGLAFDEQKCDFEPQQHDIPLDIIITPTTIFRRKNGKETA